MAVQHMAAPRFEEFENRLKEAFSFFLDKTRLFDALNALSMLDEARSDTTLTELALEWRRSALGRSGGTAHTSSAAALATDAPEPQTVGTFFERYAGRWDECQVRSREAARSLGNICAREFGRDMPMQCLREDDILGLLSHYRRVSSYNAMAARLRTALNWGARFGFCDATLAGAITRRTEISREPVFFTPEKVENIFRIAENDPAARENGIDATLALGFFAGVRTAEIRRVRWEDVDFESAVLRIPRPKGWTMGAKPRVVELEPCAVAWLKRSFESARRHRRGRLPSGLVAPSPWPFCKWKNRMSAQTGLSWNVQEHKNVMRHTYATMHVAAFRNAPATALNLGHSRSIEVLRRHYCGLISHAAAKAYWRIFPLAD